MKPYLIIMLMLLYLSTSAQEVEMIIEGQFDQSIRDQLLSSGQKDFHLTEDGSRLLMITDRSIVLINPKTGELLINKSLLTKLNSASEIAAASMDQGAGRSVNLNLEEGTGWLINEDDNMLVVLDYNAKSNHVLVFDLKSGDELWMSDSYRYTKSMDAQILSNIASNSLSLAPGMAMNKYNDDQISLRDASVRANQQFIPKTINSPGIDGWLKYIPGRNAMVLNTDQGLVCLESNSGMEKWIYDKGDINVSFHRAIENRDWWLTMNFNASFLKSSKKEVKVFDLSSGEIVSSFSFESSYKENRAYVIGDRLILDFTSLEIYDIAEGKQLYSSIPSSTVKFGNFVSSANAGGERNTESTFLGAIINEKYAYTCVGRSGGRNYPNDGSWKGVIIKINIETGEVEWRSEKLPKGSRIIDKSYGSIICKVDKGSGNYQLVFVSDENGNITAETDKYDNYFAREGAGITVFNESLLIGAKKELVNYNLESNKVQSQISLKKIPIGKISALNISRSSLVVFGDKGVHFIDKDGVADSTINTDRIYGLQFSNQYSHLFSKDKHLLIDQNQKKVIHQDNFNAGGGEILLISRQLNHWVKIMPNGKFKSFKIN